MLPALLQGYLFAQTAADVVVPITVITDDTAPSIRLEWPLPAGISAITVRKKALYDNTWTALANGGPGTGFYLDTDIAVGNAYEYHVQQVVNGAARNGYVLAGMALPPVTGPRGFALMVLDTGLISDLSQEIAQWAADVAGDGWNPVILPVDPGNATVSSVKSLIKNAYEAHPGTDMTVFLLGNLPVPYAGYICPDGHPDHCGAWPTDYYYADMNDEFWTDNAVNTTTASRPANHNIPGDGKFDQSSFPSTPEITVGRVDFGNLSGWDLNQTELYRRYLNKNHAFRTGHYVPDQQTLVDDNFGYFGGEAFARNGWQNGYAITGPTSVLSADFFGDTDTLSYLIGYGCGGGGYQSASGIGTSEQFKTDSVNIVFSMLFGSYFGDWDYEVNPFLFSALASKGGILTTAWAGRPNWYFHHTALGEPMSTSIRRTWQNAFTLMYPGNSANGQIHECFLGDPTLRLHALSPVGAPVALPVCGGIELLWTEVPGAAGYLVYRSESMEGPFAPVTPEPVTGSSFIDPTPLPIAYYQVRAVALQVTPTGSYYNQSTGVATGPVESITPLTVNVITTASMACTNQPGTIQVAPSGGIPPYSVLIDPAVDPLQAPAGDYSIMVTDVTGCTVITTAQVGEAFDSIQVSIQSDSPACVGQVALYTTEFQGDFYQWVSEGGDIALENGASVSILWNDLGTGNLFFTGVNSAGCTAIGSLTVEVESCVGADVAGMTPAVIYPNPASDYFTVEVPAWIPGKTFLRMTDIQGRSVLDQPVHSPASTVSVAHLPSGVYEVALVCGDAIHLVTLIKQ